MWPILLILAALGKKRKALMGGPAGMVVALIVIGVAIVVGAITLSKSFVVLDGLRDTDFTAAANATIAGVSADFWKGADLIRLLMIVIPASAVLAAVIYYLAAKT